MYLFLLLRQPTELLTSLFGGGSSQVRKLVKFSTIIKMSKTKNNKQATVRRIVTEAIRNGDVETVDKHMPDPIHPDRPIYDNKNRRPVHLAILADQPVVIEYLNNEHDIDLNAHEMTHTPLTFAITQSCTDSVRTLLNCGADPNCAMKGGDNNFTPLHNAVQHNEVQMAKLLLDAGANTSMITTTNGGGTSMHIAARNNYVEIVRLLVDYDRELVHKSCQNNEQPVHVAARQNASETLEALVNAGANINAQCDNGDTVLRYLLRYHLNKGGDPYETLRIFVQNNGTIPEKLQSTIRDVMAGKKDKIKQSHIDNARILMQTILALPAEEKLSTDRFNKAYTAAKI